MNSVNWRNNLAANALRTPSPAIWADCPVRDLLEDPGKGLYFFDDFQDLPLVPTLTTQIAYGKYKAYAASGCSIAGVSAVNSVELQGGTLSITMDTDNDEAAIGQAYNKYLMSGLTSNSGKLWFECCYAQNSIATNMASTFLGLATTDAIAFAANTPHNSGDAITNDWYGIGFRIEEDGLGVIDTVYTDGATSFTNIGDTEAGTLTANTFRKLGFVYDPAGPSDSFVTFYANNQALTTKLSKSTLTGLTNLDANNLGLLWSVAADSAGTSFAGYLKWWRVAQLFPAGI
jgi:hypothetical protein